MPRYTYSFSLLLIGFLVAGCSGSGSSTSNSSSTYREDLGNAPQGHIVLVLEQELLTRYGYRFQRNAVSSEDLRFETDWKDLGPLDDEQEAGIGFVRVRITVTGRPRTRGGGGDALTFNARFLSEYEARGAASGDYAPMEMTPMRKEYVKEIAERLRIEIQSGVRF